MAIDQATYEDKNAVRARLEVKYKAADNLREELQDEIRTVIDCIEEIQDQVDQDSRYGTVSYYTDEAVVLARLQAKLKALMKQEEELQDEIRTVVDCIEEIQDEVYDG